MTFRVLATGVALCALAATVPAQAEEVLLSFRSDIQINRDATLTVTEHIRFVSERKQIKRGIYRDFPMRVEVLEVLRDGQPDGYHVERSSGSYRLYVGKEDYLLRMGEHSTSITYRTPFQVSFFEDHDELWWQVTGTGWAFPILESSATVTLPESLPANAIDGTAYAGVSDSRRQDYETTEKVDGRISMRATRKLGPGEGFTVVVTFPKGIVDEPSRADRVVAPFLFDRGSRVALAGLMVIVMYFVAIWALVGRDPAAGRILPQDHPPKDISPAAMRFISEMGFDGKVFSVALINMAVKGYIRIEKDEDKTYFIVRDQADDSVLTPDEKKVIDTLLGGATSIELDAKNHAKVAKAMSALQKALKRKYQQTYFVTNSKYVFPGFVLMVLVVVSAAFAYGGEARMIALFLSFWLSIWTIAVYALLKMAFDEWRNLLLGQDSGSIGGALGATAFAIPFSIGEVVALVALIMNTSPTFGIVLVCLPLTLTLFYEWLKAPTHLGRNVLDKIEGFKMYLEGEGTHRFAANSAEENTRRFETYLPYAIAVGEEEPWASEFEDSLTSSAVAVSTDRHHYYPAWYGGSDFQSLGTGGFATSLGSAFSSAVSSASTAPSSSGSGGGGSVGGGGGGGGGGGW